MRTPKTIAMLSVTLFAGVSLGLIVASNLDWTESGMADDRPTVTLGSSEPGLTDQVDLLAASKGYVKVVKKVMPTVVSITSEKVVRVGGPLDFFTEDWWHRRRGGREKREYRQDGLGSGVVISPDGYILTNNHVIREAESVAVLIEKKKYKAEIIGADPLTDLAVIKIEASGLPAAKLGDSDALEVGELVLAVGNPFSLQLAHSVTAGIVSGKGRTRVGVGDIYYQDFIQTDAAINPGNSGGALVNMRGELVGINTAIVSSSWGGGNVGIGFAIPVNLARQISKQLIESGRVVRGWLGVYIQSADQDLAEALELPSADGALVTGVSPGSPAAKAGLMDGDFIIEIENTPVRDSDHLMNLVAGYKPESEIVVKFIRKGEQQQLTVKLGERPDEPAPAEPSESPEFHLGLTVEDLTEKRARQFGLEGKEGVVVSQVEPGSQAMKEGIRPGDLIREVNRQPVTSVAEFERSLAHVQPGDLVLLRILRDASNFFVALKAKND